MRKTSGCGLPSETLRDRRGRTPLPLAAMKGHRASVELLLEYRDGPVDAKDNAGHTATALALENNFYGVHSVLEAALS